MSNKKYRIFYLSSLILVVAASAYPLYMGAKIFGVYLTNGIIPVEEYPKYVIPYTPMCIGLILVTAVYPLLYGRLKKRALPVASVLGIATFLIAERVFERIPVVEGYKLVPLESWQYSLCIATPEVLQAIGEPIYAENNPAFKVHFYLIVMLIILVVTGGFFVLFGVTAGVYVATLRHSLGPAIAVLTTLAMYVGELVLMGGELFRFGRGMFFDRLGAIPFSLCDFLIIGAAGAVTRMIGKRLSGE